MPGTPQGFRTREPGGTSRASGFPRQRKRQMDKFLYLRLTATAPSAFDASFWISWGFRTGLAALKAPAVARETALNIMADCRGVGTVTRSEVKTFD